MKKLLVVCLALSVLLLAGCKTKPVADVTTGADNGIFDDNGNLITDPQNTLPNQEQSNGETGSQSTQPSIPDGPANPGDADDLTVPDDDLPTPQPTTPQPTQPATPDETVPEATIPEDHTQLDYLQFHALSAVQQQQVMESFESIEAFFAWYDGIRDKYERENPAIEVDGPIDLEQVLGGK